MAIKELIIYQTEEGKEPFTQWRKSLKDKVTIARIDRRLDRVAEGHYGDYKVVGEGVYELRLFFGPGYRVYFAEDGDKVVLLLCGGDKGSQDRDIGAAHSYWQDYQRDRAG
ncbi:MAG: type II toxin-antitoxin system RelE/ParE family toxin [Deinococcota bacterium]|nr:type II toxin-antitoxin system RelE/ParE family toxin [Deinococcota bacterium]